MKRERKEVNLTSALIGLIVVIGFVAIGVVKFKVQLQTMMLSAWLILALFAWIFGMTFEEVESTAYKTISRAIPTCMIMMATGVLVASWIMAGTVSTLLYAGLSVCTPKFFLLVTYLLAAVVSVASGTSWGTVGTVGLAMLGVSMGLGVPVGMTVGAIVSGSFFGDKMSPASDSTNLAAASAGTNVIAHVKCMMYTTVPAFSIR